MGQKEYNNWIEKTDTKVQDHLCGGNHFSANERYFIDKYAKETILDIGCGTGHRTFPEWERRNLHFYGIEKYQKLKEESKYSDKIILTDISDNEFEDNIQQISISDLNLAVLLGGVINGLIEKDGRENTWKNFCFLLNKCDYILFDTLTHFSWYNSAEIGQEIQLYHKMPSQYFFSKNELEQLHKKYEVDIFEERTEKIGNLERTHYLIKRK